MIVIFRWWFFAGAAGLFLLGKGGLESDLSLRCSAEPSPMELRDLESSASRPQDFVKIGKHHALYDETVTRERSGKIRRVMFPIASLENGYVATCDRLRERYGRLEDVPLGQIPTLDTVCVLVIADPESATGRAALRGGNRVEAELVGTVSSFARLTSDEKKEARLALDRSDVTKVLVVEAGRAPMPGVQCIAYLLVGALTLGWAIRRFRGETRRVAPPPLPA